MTELQQEIPLTNTQVDIDLIRQQTTMGGAISLSATVAGLVPKQVIDLLGIDKGTWSKVQSDQAALSGDRLDRLANLTGNEIPLIWWAEKRGYDLQRKETEVERENRLLREELAKEREKREYAESILTGRVK